MNKNYTIGIDFGTLSARAVLVDLESGKEAAISVVAYQDEVIDRLLPYGSSPLPSDFALQNPADYVDALQGLLTEVWRKGKINPEQVIGLGIDFTACTLIPLGSDYQPLCMQEAYSANPHSWPKLWKHHAAQPQADRITQLAAAREEAFLKHCGYKVSSEWMLPKILEILEEAPAIYDAASLFLEAGDWIVYLLTGNIRRSSCMAGFKALWNAEAGYPSQGFLTALDPRLANVLDKMGGPVYAPGTRAGGLTKAMADITGLPAGIPVSTALIDAHASVPAVGLCEPGKMLMIMGTSVCHMAVSEKECPMEGVSGIVKDVVVDGLYCYEAGQAAVGDIYDWFIYSGIMPYYAQEMHARNVNIFRVIDEKMAKLKPGSSGLIALDWWNGNRSVLADARLSGMLLGLTLTTTLEEIYRAIVESTAYGTRKILEAYEKNGVDVHEVFACGKLARTSKEVMQIFADVLGKRIRVTKIAQCSAYGSAMYGAVAAGRGAGGYNTLKEAIGRLVRHDYTVYEPNAAHVQIYDKLYAQYCKLHDYFGIKENVMQTLRQIKESVLHGDEAGV